MRAVTALCVTRDEADSEFQPNPRIRAVVNFNLGAGLRWVATERMVLRVDLTDYMYKIEYPTLYYSRASDNTQVVPNTQPRSFWTHNRALVLGAAYRFWR